MVRSTVCVLFVLGVTVAGQAPLAFDAVSIKPNTANRQVPEPRTNPAIGHYWRSYATAAGMIIQAYPPQGLQRIDNLPPWGRSEYYDVLAKGKPGATAAEQQQMWRSLLADRLQLQVHFETRPEPGYRLVFARADHRLGPDIHPSPLDCTVMQPPVDPNNIEATALKRCAWQYTAFGNGARTVVTGGTTMPDIARVLSAILRSAGAVVDETGLQGTYAAKLRWAEEPQPGAPPADAGTAPSIFTAVQEQLGLKMEPGTVNVPHLVVDRIERPTEN